MSLDWNNMLSLFTEGNFGAFLTEMQKETVGGYLECLNPALFITKANKEDNPTWEDTMNGPNAVGFFKACENELDPLHQLNAFGVVKREQFTSVVSSVWTFKVKRNPDGSIGKLKARFCTRGFEQKAGIDYFDIFAPIRYWQTVRLLLILRILLGLSTSQIDYTSAFIQADIDTDVYVETRRGFSGPGKVWKLKKCHSTLSNFTGSDPGSSPVPLKSNTSNPRVKRLNS
jgi:Reverse transcriptase (RNA-dependent DNA polymerase)